MTNRETEVKAKSIYELKLHEITFAHDGSLFTQAIRVAGGWIYTSIDKGHRIGASVFVPFNNEFQEHAKEALGE